MEGKNKVISFMDKFWVEDEGKVISSAYVHWDVNKNIGDVRRVWTKRPFVGQGYGSQVMQMIIDAYGDRDLELTPCPWDHKTLDRDGLIKFYEKFGFKRVGQENFKMKRPKGG